MVDRRALDCLRREHDELREEFDSLVGCLQAVGTVFSPLLHSMKFRRAAKRFPPGPGGRSLADALGSGSSLHVTLQMSGGVREEILAVRETCLACRGLVDKAQAEELYVFGGLGSLYDNERFCPRTGQWEALPCMNAPQLGSVAGVVEGSVYLLGGAAERGTAIERFDAGLRRWEAMEPAPRLSAPRAFAAAVPVRGRLYVCGGEDPRDGAAHGSVEVFDPALASSELLPARMLAPRTGLAAARLPGEGGQLFVCGGRGACGTDLALDTAEALSLAAAGSAWQPLPSMSAPREAHCATTFREGVVVCGGYDGADRFHASAERFDGAAGCWLPLPPMAAPRGGLCAARAHGRLYVFGGESSGPALTSVERFDPSRGLWELLPGQMRQGRVFFAAAAVKVGTLAR